MEGFRSLECVELAFGEINALIGTNGSGKSNILGFLKLLKSISEGQLQLAVLEMGGVEIVFHRGAAHTQAIRAEVDFRVGEFECSHRFEVRTGDDELVYFASERFEARGPDGRLLLSESDGPAKESRFSAKAVANGSGGGADSPSIATLLASAYTAAHCTYPLAPEVRRPRPLNDDLFLRQRGENLAPYLHALSFRDPARFGMIQEIVGLGIPGFERFLLRPHRANSEFIQLEIQLKQCDYPIRPSQLSDGAIWFAFLATLLLDPQPWPLIVLDEPEVGLHPAALAHLGSMISMASDKSQVILATHSPELLDRFTLDEIVVVERPGAASKVSRKSEAEFQEWIGDYRVSDLWSMNLLGGRLE